MDAFPPKNTFIEAVYYQTTLTDNLKSLKKLLEACMGCLGDADFEPDPNIRLAAGLPPLQTVQDAIEHVIKCNLTLLPCLNRMAELSTYAFEDGLRFSK